MIAACHWPMANTSAPTRRVDADGERGSLTVPSQTKQTVGRLGDVGVPREPRDNPRFRRPSKIMQDRARPLGVLGAVALRAADAM